MDVVSALHRPSSRFLARLLPGVKAAPFPGFIEPCLASLVSKVPSGAGYVHEIKLDGYRIQAHLHDGRVTLFTRSGLNWTKRFPTIAADIARLPGGKFVIDGEVVSSDTDGRPNFGALQDDLKRKRHDRMVFYVFDLLHLDGFDTRAAPLTERKAPAPIVPRRSVGAPHHLQRALRGRRGPLRTRLRDGP